MSSVADGLCWCGDDVFEWYDEHFRIARKRHRCYECGGHVETGERYQIVVGKFEGALETNKTCPRCLSVIDWIKAHVPCYCRSFGGLHDTIYDDIRDVEYEWKKEAPGFVFGLGRRLVAAKRHRSATK